MRAVFVFLQPQLAGMSIDIFSDNYGAMAITNNPSSVSRSITDVNFHSIQGLVGSGEIRILHVGTESQHADILTKVQGSVA